MPYHIAGDTIGLDDLKERIETTDLVPSRIPLLNGLGDRLGTLKKQGLNSLADLREAMKTAAKLESLARATRIEKDYLALLRREVNSYFPKPLRLTAFDWLPQDALHALQGEGIKNTAQFYSRFVEGARSRKKPKDSPPIPDDVFRQLCCLSDLVRMQWTSSTAARMFLAAGYDSVRKIAKSDPETLCDALAKINAHGEYFKGKIGLRDVKRLVHSAGYLPE